MAGAARLGDKAQVPLDAHGCLACPHPAIGPAIAGSTDVNTNRRPAIRLDDPGLHAACCGTNTWKAMQGSQTVFINSKPAVRMGDQTQHCGGIGRMVEGSQNVIIGGPPGMGVAGPSTASAGATGAGTAAAPATSAAASSSSAGSGGGGAAAAAAPSTASPPSQLAPLAPQPLVVAAAWSKATAPLASEVTLSALCDGLAGKPARFTIRDADDAAHTVATLSASCTATAVQTTWRTPSDGPPTRLVFEVAADGKQATSGVLVLVRPVEVALVVDDEPAADAAVRLYVDGAQLSARADEHGVVRFAEAPLGDYTLVLEDT